MKKFLPSYTKTLTLVLGISMLLCACENDVEAVRDLGRKKPSIEEGKNIDSYLSMNGKMQARLTAPVLRRYQGDSARKAEFPNTLHVDFYDDSMKIKSQLSANYGRYMENENKVFLRDKVVAFNTVGDSLFCDELYWDKNTEKFYTDKKVIISKNFRKDYFVGYNGMTSSQDLKDFHLFTIRDGSYTTVSDSIGADKPATTPAPPPVIPAKKTSPSQ